MCKSFPIIYQDPDILVINKPAAVVVNNAKTYQGLTVQQWFKQFWQEQLPQGSWEDLVPADFDSQYGSPQQIGQKRQGLVHRIDKDTSGILLLAKNPGSLVNLLAQFKKRLVKKTYLCLVHGQPQVKESEIRAPLARSSNNRKKFAVVATGRRAITRYRVEQSYDSAALIKKLLSKKSQDKDLSKADKKLLTAKNLRLYQPGFALVSAWPKTGRTHQIRVHMKHLGHALVGDYFYTGKKRSKTDQLWCPRQFLHASEIEFRHPRTGKKMKLQAPLAGDLLNVLALLD